MMFALTIAIDSRNILLLYYSLDILMKKTLGNCGELKDDVWIHDPRNGDMGWGENLYYGDGKSSYCTPCPSDAVGLHCLNLQRGPR